MKHEKIVWLNCEQHYMNMVLNSSRKQADKLAVKLEEDDDMRARTACLRLRITWSDGDGMESPVIELENEEEMV